MRTSFAFVASWLLAFDSPVSAFIPSVGRSHVALPQRHMAARVLMMSSSPETKPPSTGPAFSGALPIAKPEGGRTSSRRKQDNKDGNVFLEVDDETAPIAPTKLEGDLLGDGGVVKQIIREGDGALVTPGSEVTVNYEGRLEDGTVLCRGTEYKCLQGDGTMIGGWETAVGSMRVGEVAKVTIKPWYAYGPQGVAPVVGPDATLEFEFEVVDASGNFMNPRTYRDVDPKKLRDLDDITEDYARRSELRMRNEENLGTKEKIEKWFKGLYFFGFFEGETGERPPWYLTPTITFPAMFLTVAAAFYILISNGGVSIKRDLQQDEFEMGMAFLDQVWG